VTAISFRGELAARIDLTHQRFDRIQEPAFSDVFILQDVALDPATPRRFQEFSGDVSGRFLGALALTARGASDWQRLDRLVEKIIGFQRADGRFGNAELPFDAASVGRDQMALLWGNGRLLTGLMEYWDKRRNPEALAAARRLGDFLLGVFEDCSSPAVVERLRGAAANGYICFTQLNEGLELLSRATGEEKYRHAARRMLSMMDPAAEGAQHTHGFLTTMRGHMMIFESTGDRTLLEETLGRWREIEAGSFLLTNGGVLEYFKHDYNRDEGCSESDLLRLCLQLWRATGNNIWLDRAEKCLVNVFSACQFETGDFGHRCYDHWGYIATPGPGRAWWCCTMHGLRALADVADAVVTAASDGIRVNLFFSGHYEEDGFALLVNAGMFAVEIAAGVAAGSVALKADAADFLSDAANYGISLFVLGAAVRVRARAALFKGLSLGAVGLFVAGSVAWNAIVRGVPTAEVMGVVGVLALLANVGVALMLYAWRRGDANMQSVWICSRNDAIGNIAVVAAAGGVWATQTGWPDILVAAILAALAVSGAWTITRQALAELRHDAAHRAEREAAQRA